MKAKILFLPRQVLTEHISLILKILNSYQTVWEIAKQFRPSSYRKQGYHMKFSDNRFKTEQRNELFTQYKIYGDACWFKNHTQTQEF